MRIKLLDTGKELEVNEGYGTRLIEQGRAVFSAEKQKKEPAKAQAKEQEPKTEGKQRKKGD